MAEPKSAHPEAEFRWEADRADMFLIGRRLSYADSRVIGFLPASPTTDSVSSLISGVAIALSFFVRGDLGVISAWSTWNGRVGGAREPDPTTPRVFAIVPPSCDSAAVATAALEEAVASHEPAFDRILVDLSGYAPGGDLPGAADLVQGIVVLVTPRRTRRKRLERLLGSMPPGKNLGAILLG